jgi:alcohol dehydrogenase class IV
MEQKEFLGEGSLGNIQPILKEHHVRTVFMVTDKDSFSPSGAEAALSPFLEGIKIVGFSEFSPNPKVEDARRGIALMKGIEPELIVAVGGGSSIDMAKLINILSAQSGDCLQFIQGKDPIRRKGVPLVAIPTTAGTGSEATQFAVAYVGQVKYSLAHPLIIPDYVIVDPTLTYTMPPRLTATTGFDALSQAIESYWSVGSTRESKKYASEAIPLVMKSIKDAVHRPNPEARRAMAFAANLGGKAINISKTTAPHAVSYTLTIYFGIPHGHAVALTLGKFFVVNASLDNAEINDSRGKGYLKETMDHLCKLVGGSDPEECSNKLYRLMKDVGLESNLKELGIYRKEDIERIVSNVNIERLNNNPVKISEQMLLQILNIL